MNLTRTFLFSAVFLASVGAAGQWQWVDKSGVMVFSDMAPPPQVPLKNILKRPSSLRAEPEMPAPNASAPETKASAATTVASREQELAKKVKELENNALAQRAADASRMAKTKIENCVRAKKAKQQFDTGVRLQKTDQQGQAQILDDAARAAELKNIQTYIDAAC